MKEIKALVLISGGLDSMLAAVYLMKMGIKVQGLVFKSAFFSEQKAQEICQKINCDLRVEDFSFDHLKIVKNPRYGFGKAANPCIDCHLLMLKKAKEIMEREGFDFVATGEVLRQRPMSQNKGSLALIAQKSELGDRLFRPLSAKLFADTIVQKNNWIYSDKLLSFSGRGRKDQMALAKEYGIKEYPNASGGCVLTEKEFSKKLFELRKVKPDFDLNDSSLLKFGRHYWFGQWQMVISRDALDGEKIKQNVLSRDLLIEVKNFPAALALCRFHGKEEIIYDQIKERAKDLIIKHSSKIKDKNSAQFFEQII